MKQLSIRARLTALYAALFAVSAALLLGIIYWATSRALPRWASTMVDPDTGSVTHESGVGEAPPPPGEGAFTVGADTFRDVVSADLLRWSAIALAVMLVASVLIGWWLAGRVLAPIHQMTATARQMSGTERFHLGGPRDELHELADTFDDMLDRLHQGVQARSRLLANMSHELKTPLATQRVVLEVGLDGGDATAAGRQALAQNERASRVIEAMLTLARATDAQPLDTEPIDLVGVVDHSVEELSGLAAERGLRVELALADSAVTEANRALVERLVDNLVANAVRHTPVGGEVSIRLGGEPTHLVIANSGPEFTDEQVQSFLVPFRRGTAERTGSSTGQGLGLAIAAAIAEAHRATLTLAPREGGGLQVEVDFPPAPRCEWTGQ